MQEFDIIRRICARSQGPHDAVVIGPGDDMALVEAGGQPIVLAVDQLVEDVHFRIESTSLEQIGTKAVNRSLSDIAAMAAMPLASLATACLPRSYEQPQVDVLFDSMRVAAEHLSCPLVGGDITIWNGPLTLTVTVTGTPGPAGVKRRDTAQPGDRVYVTGHLGRSYPSGRHLHFTPRIHEAIALAEALGDDLHAVIDVSDGLGRDASHIARASDVTLRLEADLIPCHPGATTEQALSDGEDYELCFTVAPGATVPTHVNGVGLTEIGVVQRPRGEGRVLLSTSSGEVVAVDRMGWEHHA